MEKLSNTSDSEKRYDIIEGRFFDIDMSGLSEGLDDTARHVMLMSASYDNLPENFSSISLDYWPSDDEPYLTRFDASATFDPAFVNRYSGHDWVTQYSADLQTKLEKTNHTTTTLPHDSALYVDIDDESVLMRIDIETGMTDCTLAFMMVSRDAFETMSTELTRLDTTSRDPEKAMWTFCEIFGIGLDTAMSNFMPDALEHREAKYQITAPAKRIKHRSAVAAIAQAAQNQTEPASRSAHTDPIETVQTQVPSNQEPTPQAIMRPPIDELVLSDKGFGAIGGNFAVKHRLEQIARNFRDPEATKLYKIPPTHFLLHGPPGTGKSSLIEALAHETDAELRTVLASHVSSKWVGESAKNITNIFDEAVASERPTILFFDEIDALINAGIRGENAIEAKCVLQSRMDEISKKHPHVMLAATTNVDIDDLEPALVRRGRFETLSTRLPDLAERKDIWCTVLIKSRNEFDSDWQDGQPIKPGFVPYHRFVYYDYETFADLTDGWSGADVEMLLTEARQVCANRYQATGKEVQIDNDLIKRLITTFRRG